MPSNITAPRVPLVDPETGLISREWFRFLLNLSQGTFVKVSSLPAANTSTRGALYFVEGGTGVPDKMYVGVKLGNEAFDWQQLF